MSVERKSGEKTACRSKRRRKGPSPERLGRPEPQQKVQESPRRLRIEGLEKGAPPRPSRASSARSEPLEQAKAAEKRHKQGSNQNMFKERTPRNRNPQQVKIEVKPTSCKAKS